MEKILMTKDAISTIGGIFGGMIAVAFGGWSEGLTTLLILMIIDYISGLVVAGLFKAAPKSGTGGLESRAGWKGLMRKVFTLLVVVVAYHIDVTLGTAYFMNAAIIGFIVNELISLVENMGLMGVPMPKAISKAIDVLTSKAEAEEKAED